MALNPRSEASPPFVLAIDIGTSSVRALICDQLGRAIDGTEAQRTYDLVTSQDGGAEFDAPHLFDMMVKVVDDSMATGRDLSGTIVAVGVTSFWHSLLGLDHDGRPATPIYFWADSRSDSTIEQLRPLLNAEDTRQRTGCRLHSSYWPAKLFWLRQTDPDRFHQVRRWLSFTEYAGQRLTANPEPEISISMASGTGLLDVHRLIWDDELCDILGLRHDQLPRLVDVDHRAQLRPTFAQRWPALDGAAWYPALGDGACANVGSGAVNAGRIALTLGTSGAMRIVVPAPANSSWMVPPGLWAYRLDAEHAIVGGALSNGGNFRRWISELTGSPLDDQLAAAVSAEPADGHGLTILPFIAGERSPSWHAHATGVIGGLTLATTPVHLARAGMEAIAFRFAKIYEALLPVASAEHEIVANGGAIVSSPEWTQIIASVFGHEVLSLPAGDEATARGAALMALRSAGVLASLDAAPDPAADAVQLHPDEADYAVYRSARVRQEALEALFFPGWREATTTGGVPPIP